MRLLCVRRAPGGRSTVEVLTLGWVRRGCGAEPPGVANRTDVLRRAMLGGGARTTLNYDHDNEIAWTTCHYEVQRMQNPSPEDGPYRGVALPGGMSRECLDAVTRIINKHQREDCDDLDSDCAVKVLEAVHAHWRP
jgi:hypothetical protein